jgi:hypothetical protein
VNRFVCCRFRHAGAGDEIVRNGSVTIFVMARLRGDQTDSMPGTLRAGPHGWDAVYTLNGELYI